MLRDSYKQGESMVTVLFSGQGTQKKGMGQELFSKYSSLVKECSDLLGYSIEDLCIRNEDNLLSRTQYLQPALFFVNMLHYLEMQPLKHQNYILGHSLGEYNALCAAGAFDIQTGIQLVKKRAELMEVAGKGKMLAVLGKPPEAFDKILRDNNFQDIDIANYNTPIQTVLSGPEDSINRCSQVFLSLGLNVIHLNVSGAFHSRYMKSAAEEYQNFLQKFSFKNLHCPVISNVTASEYSDDSIADLLTQQLFSPVKWMDSILKVTEKGGMDFLEVGSSILSKMVKDIKAHNPSNLGSINPAKSNFLSENTQTFKERVGVKYAYVAGSMYRGIASPNLVIRMAKSGFLSFYGIGGLDKQTIAAGIQRIQESLRPNQPFGVNFLANYAASESEFETIELLLKYGIQNIEASAFLTVSPALAYFAIKGLYRDSQSNKVRSSHRVFTKVSRLETAKIFMTPPPEHIIQRLLKLGKINLEEASLAKEHPISNFICVEGDSGGHTDRKPLGPLLISVNSFRESINKLGTYSDPILIGAAGGIGDPVTMANALILGADFVLTGSINQCSIESGTSDPVKELLSHMGVGDTTYTIAGDMFEMGGIIQTLKRGVLFPIRATTLHSIYTLFEDLNDIPDRIKRMLENQFFQLSFQEIIEELGSYYSNKRTPKEKMAAVFKWYLRASNIWAIEGNLERISDFQIHTGPALGLFNQWVKGTSLENWRNRHVDEIALTLMEESDIKMRRNSTVLL